MTMNPSLALSDTAGAVRAGMAVKPREMPNPKLYEAGQKVLFKAPSQ